MNAVRDLMTTAEGIKPRTFLTAHWSNLAILSYAVPAALLEPLAPPGCELDTVDGNAFVSLVAFDFLQTKVWNVAWPGARDFPEVNLRIYVRHEGRRGVAFIREFVPCHIVAAIARWTYNEPYLGAPMTSQVQEGDNSISVRHELVFGGRRNVLQVSADKPPVLAGDKSIEHFFMEHSWGYGKSRSGELIRYQVEHDVWQTYQHVSHHLDWDWGLVYGPQWAFLQDQKPYHLLLAAGSPVRVIARQ